MADERILRTENGSPVRRASIGVGKDMRGLIYLHKNYEQHLPNQKLLQHAKRVLKQNHPDFQYNVVKYDPHGSRISFFNSPDFDTAHEPVAGDYVTVDGKNSKRSKTNKIWHHKWLWVKDDYPGFDVDESFRRSRAWLKLKNIDFNRIGDKALWERDYVPRIGAY